jgi:nickel/cobalt transporter (NicO) family protein
MALLALLPAALSAGDDAGHPGPDVFFFYELRLERGRLHFLHETRWTDQYAQELLEKQIDRDGDGEVSLEEGNAFARAWAERVGGSFRLEVQARPVALGDPEITHDTYVPTARDLERLKNLGDEGVVDVAGLEIFEGITWEFRVYLDFVVPLPDDSVIQIDLFEATYQEPVKGEVLPWVTNALIAYGDPGLSFLEWTEPASPLQLTPEIQVVFDWSARGPSLVDWKEHEDPDQGLRDLLADIIRGKVGLILGMLIALIYGMGHALMPGHGKAMVAAYLIGTRGRMRDAITLGLIVTFTHMFAIMVVAILTDIFLSNADRKSIEAWLGVASGLGIVVIGLWLLVRNSRALVKGEAWFDRGHAHAHAHEHGPDLARDHLHGHEDHGDHDHHRDHGPHDDGLHSHEDHGDHDHHARHHHHHGHHHHHRMPTSFKELLALGVTGGIVPCPSAVVIYFWAIQNDYPWMATLVVGMFSLGLAVVLVLIGLLMVTSTKTLEKLSRGQQRLQAVLRVLPWLSSVLILIVGLVVTYTAFAIK